MRVFITGATGFVGSVATRALIAAGHQVLGLARNDAAAETLAKMGAEVHRGELFDAASIVAGAEASDGVIHTAFIHDFSQFAANIETDRVVVEAVGAALAGSGKPLVIASGTAVSGFAAPGKVGTETDEIPAGLPRMAADVFVRSLADKGVRSSVVRLPPSVHDTEKMGLISYLIAIAKEKGVSAYGGAGQNRWPGVHRLDAGHLFTLALLKGVAGHAYHGVAEEGVPLRQIAEVIARRLSLPLVSQTPEQAMAHFGWLGPFVGLDCPSSSAITQAELGWRPAHRGVLADLEEAADFAG